LLGKFCAILVNGKKVCSKLDLSKKAIGIENVTNNCLDAYQAGDNGARSCIDNYCKSGVSICNK
jgi:hypothetical protein